MLKTLEMNKQHNLNYEDRLKFLIAIMTENYENAMKIGTTVLKQNPNDLRVSKILSAVKDKIAVNSLAESVASDSDEDIISNEVNMQINIDTNDLDFDMNDEKKNSIDTKQNYQKLKSVPSSSQNLSDCIKKYLLSRIGMEKKSESFVFQEKMYRVIPMKINRN
ncbi:PREDICTED: uncharacterized protein LOC107070704 [Polistes dominula]|uniref:Uncharacterized protein LOC107070704 n=1 Tax=Polistes dominula TaxID=743375 RepID=A0ABM1IWP0_POLDO|nr:PREDICTED: uncharacterized protein LOC107070704 [Polistes dominula]